MAIQTFTSGQILTAADTNTYLANAGLVYVTQASASTGTTSINSCFTSTYANYRIVIVGTGATSASAQIYLRFRAGGVDNSTANYRYSYWATNTTGGSSVTNNNATGEISLGLISSVNPNNSTVMDILNPQINKQTNFTWQRQDYDGANHANRNGGGIKDAVEQYDGMSIITAAGTFTGTIYVYGYRNS